MSEDRKTCCLYLDPEVVLLAQWKCKEIFGDRRKISQIVNDFLSDFVTDGEITDRPDPIKEKARELTRKKIKEFREQKKIISESEAAKLEAEQYRSNRDTAVRNAAVRIFLRYRISEKWLPEHDVHGDHLDDLEKITGEICKLSGHDTDTGEICAIYRGIHGMRYISYTETSAPEIGFYGSDEP